MKRLQFSLRTILIAVSLIGLGLGTLLAVREWLQNRVTIENRTGQTVEQVVVVVEGGSGSLYMGWRDLPAGSRVSSPFEIAGDQHFLIEGSLADGTEFREEHGYVTGGMRGVRANIVIKPGGAIDFRQN